MARVRSVLRRYEDKSDQSKEGNLTIGKIHLNKKAHKVFVDTKEIDLTLIEYKILLLFYVKPRVALTRDKLLDKIWGHDIYVTDRAVDVNIKRLRDKLLEKKRATGNCSRYWYRFSDA